MSQRPTLVLLHGAVLNGRMWDPVATALGAEYQVLTPDLPGHGTRAGEPFRLATAVAVVRDVVEALAPAPVVLGGDSLGSYVALTTAPSLGDRLQGLVLAGGTATFQGPVVLSYLAQIALTRLVPPAKLHDRLAERIAREYLAGTAILEGGIRPAAFAEAVAELRRVDFRALLSRLDLPVLFVNGTRDWSHRLAERKTVAAGRRAELRHIRGVGHGVSLTRPAEFAALIRTFMSRDLGGPLGHS